MPDLTLLAGQIAVPAIRTAAQRDGHPLDYDRWANECDLIRWRYVDCLPYFKAGETSDRGADDWRGDAGPLGVIRGSFENPLYDAFLDAGEQAGQGRSEDLNGFQPEGVAGSTPSRGTAGGATRQSLIYARHWPGAMSRSSSAPCPRSRGHVTLRSHRASDKPALHFNCLADAHDLNELVGGVHKARDTGPPAGF